MKEKLFVCLIGFFCFSNTACLKDESTAARSASSTSTPVISPEVVPTVHPQTDKSTSSANKNQLSKQTDKKVNLEQLQNDITNNLGDLLVVDSYKPSTLEADLNGDGFVDMAIVVAAKDRFSDKNKTGDMFSGLAYTSEGLTFQNLRSGGILFAKPRLSGIDIEKNKAKLKPESNLGLLIILSDSKSWQAEIEKTTYNKKFLLLDAVFQADFEDEQNAPDLLSVIKKGDECLPKEAKGEGIYSGDRESGGKTIYFNGKSFAWTQCGD